MISSPIFSRPISAIDALAKRTASASSPLSVSSRIANLGCSIAIVKNLGPLHFAARKTIVDVTARELGIHLELFHF